jgi:hypothetical protein
MVPFRLWNNDSLPTQFCIYRPTGGEPTQKMDKDSHGQRDMELRSTEGEGPPLFLGRKKDRNKEQHCGEQHNGRTGGDIPVRGDEYSPD